MNTDEPRRPQEQDGWVTTPQDSLSRPTTAASSVNYDFHSHLVPHSTNPSPPDYNRAQRVYYTVTSHICTSLFLMCLFTCAFFHYIYHALIRKEQKGEVVPLDPKELKLKPDLDYYFQLLGLRVDTYEIVTEDGFVLQVQRIVNPQESPESRSRRKPILCVHGLLQSAGSFCSSGKDSLAYFLHQSGYDVWLGNNRCGFHPRHMLLTPDDPKMWDWDVVEMAKFDLPAMIDHVLHNSYAKVSKIGLICHSQGTAQGFIAFDQDKFGLASKVHTFIALAPAVYAGPLLETKVFVKVISKMSQYNFFFGVTSFLPIMMTMRSLLLNTKLFAFFSYMMFNFLFDWTDRLWNKQLKGRHFLFSPVYVSVKLMSWWLDPEQGFKHSKSILEDDKPWFTEDSPGMLLIIPRRDLLVDGQALVEHMHLMENRVTWRALTLDSYSHLDVLWSQTVIEDVGKHMVRFIERDSIFDSVAHSE